MPRYLNVLNRSWSVVVCGWKRQSVIVPTTKSFSSTKTLIVAQFRSSSSSSVAASVGTATIERIPFSFKEGKSGHIIEVQGIVGKTVMETAIDNNVDIEGACGGELACSTCHVILSKTLFEKLPKRVEEEEDMLDLAWGTTDT